MEGVGVQKSELEAWLFQRQLSAVKVLSGSSLALANRICCVMTDIRSFIVSWSCLLAHDRGYLGIDIEGMLQ